jgi:hypothetical protein
MNTKLTFGTAIAAGVLAFAGSASAQSQAKDQPKEESSSATLAPATHAVELTIGAGYQQAFGKVSSSQPSLTDIGNAGGALQVGVGYRIIPQLTLGLYGSGAAFGRGDQVDNTANLYSAAAGIQADWHFLPSGHELDPWVSLGTGWRGYWINQTAGNTSAQGMELAKLQVGLDYRLDRTVSISPVIGADLSTFFTQSTPDSSGFHDVPSPEVNTFVFAGVMGRFDIATESDRSQVASR